MYFCDGQVSPFAEGRGLHCTWPWVSSQLHYPGVDSVCFITLRNFEESPTSYKRLLCGQWTLSCHWQRDQISSCLQTGVQFWTITWLKWFSANRFLNQLRYQHNGVRSVILLSELLWLYYEKHKVHLCCCQTLKVKFPGKKEVVLKPWSISHVNLPEVTYHSGGDRCFHRSSVFLTL